MNIGVEDEEYLAHYGTKGQKWGVRRYQNEDGSLTEEGKKRYGNSVFISGTTKTSEDGTYKRDELPKKITDKIDEYIGSGRKILVGDAPGVDSQIQDYLSNKNYKNVEVFVSGDEVRKLAGGKLGWTVNKIDGENFEKHSKEWRAVKDKAMNAVASEGLAVVIKDGSGATRKNIDRFIQNGKAVMVYQLDDEDFVDPILNQKEYEKMKHDDLIKSGEEFLAHHGIKGQQWGQRRFQNEDGTLTEEGRRRYGLNPKYAGMTDKEIRDALDRKRTQNEYIQNITAGARKKQQDIKGLTTEALNVAGQGVNLYDKTKWESDRKEAQRNIDVYTAKKQDYLNVMSDMKDDYGKKAVKTMPEYMDAKSQAEDLEKRIKEQKGVKDEGIKAKKDMANAAVNAGKTYAPDIVSKGLTSREIKEKTAEAQRNIEEMDPDQLKKVVERMKLEKQYDELINPPKPSAVERGREALQTIGAILGVTLTALGIVEAVKKINGGKKGEIAHVDFVEAGEEFLAHYRTKGSRNGVRRYQNEDGSLTPEGYRHYGIDPNGRQAADPREILARQRAQEKADVRQAKAARRQAGYTQKFAERQALRDAKNQARIQNVYDRQAIRSQRVREQEDLRNQREQYRMENEARAENRANIRKNIVKGVASIASIGAALYVGRHFLRERALDNQYARDVGKIKADYQGKIDLVKEQSKTIQYENETKRKLGLKGLEIDKYKAETDRKNSDVEKFKAKTSRIESKTTRYKAETSRMESKTTRYKAETDRMENKALNENEDLNKKVKSLNDEKSKIEKRNHELDKRVKDLDTELETNEKKRDFLKKSLEERGKETESLRNELSKSEEELNALKIEKDSLSKEKEHLRGQLDVHEADQRRRDAANKKRSETRARNAKINEEEIKNLAKNGKFVLSGLFSGSIKRIKKGG